MVQPSWPKSVPAFKVDRSRAGFVTISTVQLLITVNLNSLSIEFHDSQTPSTPFLTEQSHSFAPDIDAASGGASFVASCVWGPLSENEALYGGGSFQSGIIDFRNVPVNLVQFNTEVFTPFGPQL
jgi:alpha-D-xyloside xylohydrolase